MRALRAAGQGLAVLALGAVLCLAVLEGWMRLQPRRLFAIYDERLGFRRVRRVARKGVPVHRQGLPGRNPVGETRFDHEGSQPGQLFLQEA